MRGFLFGGPSPFDRLRANGLTDHGELVEPCALRASAVKDFMSKPKPLRSILDDSLKSLGLDAPMKGYSVWGAWREIVGDAVAANARPSVIRNRILFIEVSHPTWVQQLQFLKPTLLEKLNGFLGEPLIDDIRFRVGKISSSPPPPAKDPDWTEEDPARETLTRIETLLRGIEDAETRKTMRDVLIKGAKLEQHRRKSK